MSATMSSAVYRLAPAFCDDHWARDCGQGDTVVKRGKFCLYVKLDDVGYADMLSDSLLYSDAAEFPDNGQLVQSARRVHVALVKQGPPSRANTDVRPRKASRRASEPAPVAQGPDCITIFGWCLEGVGDGHADCRVSYFSEFDNRQHTCRCVCHG